MISDDELSELPSDPELAFVQIERLMRSRLQEEERLAREDDADTYRLEYMNKVAAAAKAFGIEALSSLIVPRRGNNYSAFIEEYSQFLIDVDHVTMQIRIHSAIADREGTVGLDDIDRSKIHHFIQQIRAVIQNANLPDDKRDALLDKLNRFATEVDRRRTKLQTAITAWIAIASGIGQGFKELEPARKMIEAINDLLGRRKENEERGVERLPPPSERKKIEPPPRRLPPSSKPKQGEFDDEIPF